MAESQPLRDELARLVAPSEQSSATGRQFDDVLDDIEYAIGAPIDENNVAFKNHPLPSFRKLGQAPVQIAGQRLQPFLKPGRKSAIFVQLLLQARRELPSSLRQAWRESARRAALAVVFLNDLPFLQQKPRGRTAIVQRERRRISSYEDQSESGEELDYFSASDHTKVNSDRRESMSLVTAVAMTGRVAAATRRGDAAVATAAVTRSRDDSFSRTLASPQWRA